MFLEAFIETIYMVSVSTLIAVLLGLPLGILLTLWHPRGILARPSIYQLLSSLISGARSLPFIILMIILFPLSRLLVGTTIGTTATIVPLSMSAIPFVAALMEGVFSEVNPKLVEAAEAMGASKAQVITLVYLSESKPSMVRGITLTMINLIGYSAMAGAIGGGGLGDIAIRYGFHRFQTDVLIVAVLLLMLLVQLIQWGGHQLASKIEKHW